MASLTLMEIAQLTRGKILSGNHGRIFSGFEFDSREIKNGDLFFALVAQRDGHDFLLDAYRRGAKGAIISRDVTPPHSDFGLVKVSNTLQALQDLAREIRKEKELKIVGITGSLGKTTTKEYTAALLSSQFSVLKSKKSFNNQIGLPYTLLHLEENHQIAVLEMGMNHRGEIRELTTIAPPDVAVITGINPVHTQFFADLEEIAAAKREILEGASPGATAVLAGDDRFCLRFAQNWSGPVILFGQSPECSVRISNLKLEGWGGYSFDLIYHREKIHLRLPVVYQSYVYNFAASAATASVFSLSLEKIQKTASTLKPLPNRGEVIDLGDGIHVINDVYNSSPPALEAALDNLSPLPARRKIAVLGDMLELGVEAEKKHFQVGQKLAHLGWDLLLTVGPLSYNFARGAFASGFHPHQVISVDKAKEAAEKIPSLIQPHDLILVKGSRRIKMEKIIERLKQDFQGGKN